MIYKLTNKITNDFYVGLTSQTLDQRFRKHISSSKTGKTYLYKAMRKYGCSNFEISLLESCTNDKNCDREIYWIAKLKPKYNMTAGGTGGDTSSSPNWKAGMERTRLKYKGPGNPNYGKLRGNSPNAMPVIVEGIKYDCLQDARDKSGRGYRWIKKYGTFI